MIRRLRAALRPALAAALLACASSKPEPPAAPAPPPAPSPAPAAQAKPAAPAPAANPLIEEVTRVLGLDTELLGTFAAWEREIEPELARQEELHRQGRGGELLEVYERSLAAKETPVAHYLRGRMLGKLERFEAAREEMEKSLALDKRFYYGHEGLALYWFNAKREPLRGDEEMRRALQVNKEFIRARVGLAGSLLTRGEFEAALKEFQQVPHSSPLYEGCLAGMGQCYARLDRLELAEAMFRESIQRNDADPLRHVALADVLRRRNQKDKALTAVEEALKRKPDHAEARLLKAQLLAERGSRPEALALVQALLQDPAASGDVKKAARRVLQGLDPAQAQRTPPTMEELLRDLEKNPDPKVRREAIEFLSRVPGAPMGPFVRAVRDQDQSVRVIALRVAAARRGKDVLPILGILVQSDPSKLVRGAACAELGKLTDEVGRPIDAGAPFLLGALQDADPYVFEQADQALARISGRAPAEAVPGGPTPERRAEISKRWEEWWRSVPK